MEHPTTSGTTGEIVNEKKFEENFIFTEELYRRIEEEKNKCIRSVLWTLEVIFKDKESQEFIKTRKCVLDSVNDMCRSIKSITDKVL